MIELLESLRLERSFPKFPPDVMKRSIELSTVFKSIVPFESSLVFPNSAYFPLLISVADTISFLNSSPAFLKTL